MPATERAMLCLVLARHWDSQSASRARHRRARPGRRGTPRLARTGSGPASLLGYDLLCQAVSDPSLSHSRKKRSGCRWQRGPDSESSIQLQAKARNDGRPGTRQEDSSSNHRSWRATQVRWKRAFAGIIRVKDGEASRSSESGRALSRVGQPELTWTRTCVMLASPESVWNLFSKRVTAAADSPAPDSSRLSRRSPGPTLSRVARLGVRPGLASVLGNGRLPFGPCLASGSPTTRWRPSQPSLMMALYRVA